MQTQADITAKHRTWAIYDIATIDGRVHRGFGAWSPAQARLDFLQSDPGYREQDICEGGVVLRQPEAASDAARVGFWKTRCGRGVLEDLVPGLVCPPEGEADARRMEAWADHMADWPHLTSDEARSMRALRIYAAEVRKALKQNLIEAA